MERKKPAKLLKTLAMLLLCLPLPLRAATNDDFTQGYASAVLEREFRIKNCNAPLNLALPQFPCSGTGESGSVQHPLAEQIELCASIALSLQEFQFRNLALDLPVAVGQREGCLHSGLLAL
jgi:hypothetical protein